MNIREFIRGGCPEDGTYDVQWDSQGNLDIIRMDIRFGYMVSTPGDQMIISGSEPVTIDGFWDWVECPAVKLGLETFYLGVWTDVDTGKVYFDVSVHYTAELEAAKGLGRLYDQLAIWDNEMREAITL